MRLLIIPVLLCASMSALAEKTMRFTTSASADAFPEILAMFTTLYSRMGYRLELVKLPDRRAVYDAGTRGWVDGELARVKDAETLLPGHIRIPVPISKVASSAFVKDLNFEVKGWQSLSPYRLGTLRGIIAIEKPLKGFRVVEAGSPAQLLKMLNRGRIEVAVMPKPMGVFALKDLNYNIKILEPPIDSFILYHYIKDKHRSLVPQLTAVLSELTGEPPELDLAE